MVGYFNSITRNYYYWLLYELLYYKYYRIYFLLDKFICSLGIIIKIDIRYINPIFNASDVENFNINTDIEVDFNQRIKLYRLILI